MHRSFRIFLTFSAAFALLNGCGDDSAPADSGADAREAGPVDGGADEGADDGADAPDIPMGSCEEDNGGCDPLVLCSIRENGSVACGRCPSGYSGTGIEGCVDVNECAVDNGGCDPLVSCNNLVGSRECAACPPGYNDVNGNGTRCTDIDECATENGGCGLATCVNMPGGFMCEGCPMGFAPNGEGECVDVDECATNNGGCDTLTTCTNTRGARTCGPCPSGYAGSGETSCMNIDECATDNGGCEELCIDVDGDFTCACNGERVLGDDGISCFDPLLITPASLPDGQLDEPYAESLSVSGGDGNYTWSVRSGSLPDALMVQDAMSATPQVVGTPTAPGEFTFRIEVRDTAGNAASREFAIAIAPAPLSIETSMLPSASLGMAYSADVLASGGSESAYTWRVSAGALPRGVDVDGDGTPSTLLSGTPAEAGSFTFTLTVRDGDGAEASREFSIDVAM